MGIGYNMLSVSDGALSNNEHNLHLQLQEPDINQGLWIKTDKEPNKIISMPHSKVKRQFEANWNIISIPSGYRTFAVVGNYMYLLGNTNGRYLKTNLLNIPYQWSTHTAGSSIEFTSTDTIGTKIYATHEGSSLNVYQMDTDAATPTLSRMLPTVTSFRDPKICASGNKIYALSGGTSGEQKIMEIDISQSNPSWSHIRSINNEDTSMCSIIVNNNVLYIIGSTYYGEKCYAIDLNDPNKKLNNLSGFTGQGVLSPALSNIGGLVRILNCGFSDVSRNTLTLIDGIWKGANMTDLTQLNEVGASYSRAYHTDYSLFIKEYLDDNTIYRLDRRYPSNINIDDNTLIITKSDKGQEVDVGELDNYRIKESISGCYYYSSIDGLKKLPIAYYNEATSSWSDMAIDD